MNCQACADFEKGGNLHFFSSCLECRARSIASSHAWKAFTEGWPEALRHAIERQFGGDTELGMRMVLRWALRLSTKEEK